MASRPPGPPRGGRASRGTHPSAAADAPVGTTEEAAPPHAGRSSEAPPPP
ncbi:MAG: hypothetical protein JWM27_300, partial [Gemmatimonadetes bacterium]|nr:hypothetical protein [Gemmatimonadota bacterium]